MKTLNNIARFLIVTFLSFAITSSLSAAQSGLLFEQSNPVETTYQSMIHKVHSTTINEDGSRTVRHCKSKTECRYCTKKCLAPAKCIARDCCTEWSKSECRIGPAPEDVKTYN